MNPLQAWQGNDEVSKLYFSIILLLIIALFEWNMKGPLWVFAIVWLICIFPIFSGLLTYGYFAGNDIYFDLTLAAYLGCFYTGFYFQKTLFAKKHFVDTVVEEDFIQSKNNTWIFFIISIVGIFSVILDFYFFKIAGLDNLSELRDGIVGADAASWFARIGSVMTWACLYLFSFALYFKERLTKKKFCLYSFPIIGFFLTALLSAGRQASFLIILFVILIPYVKRHQSINAARQRYRSWPLAVGVSFVMIGYMGYIAIARNDGRISDEKADVLLKLFDVTIAPCFENFIGMFGSSVRNILVETSIYFSHSLPLFSKFLEVTFPRLYFGAMSFPVAMRQLQDFTGINVTDALHLRTELIDSTGVIGVGWTTAISSYIMDFGYVGAGAVLFLQGAYMSYAWFSAISSAKFHRALVAVILLVLTIYMPLLAASGDTNIFLLWFVCVSLLGIKKFKTSRYGRQLFINNS